MTTLTFQSELSALDKANLSLERAQNALRTCDDSTPKRSATRTKKLLRWTRAGERVRKLQNIHAFC